MRPEAKSISRLERSLSELWRFRITGIESLNLSAICCASLNDLGITRWTRTSPLARVATGFRTVAERPRIEAVPSPGSVRVHLVLPRSFNDAQQIADKFKQSIPVILNLQGADAELSKRLIDFTSGLTYALNGGMQRVADKVFLLTPRNVEVSAEQRAALLERGGFFNQA